MQKRNNAYLDIFGRPSAGPSKAPSPPAGGPPLSYPSYQQQPYTAAASQGYSNYAPQQSHSSYTGYAPQPHYSSQQSYSGQRSQASAPYASTSIGSKAPSSSGSQRSSYYPSSEQYYGGSNNAYAYSNGAGNGSLDNSTSSSSGGVYSGGYGPSAGLPLGAAAQGNHSATSSAATHYPTSYSSSSNSTSATHSPAASITPSLSPVTSYMQLPTSIPPRLPEVQLPTDDFFGFESARQPDPRDSFDSAALGGAAGYFASGTEAGNGEYGYSQGGQDGSPRSFYSSALTEEADDFVQSAPRSSMYLPHERYSTPSPEDAQRRRPSNDSDRNSLYRASTSGSNRPLLALNPSLVSLNPQFQPQQQYSPQYASPQSYATPPSMSRRSSESVRVMPTQPRVSGYNQDRAYSFSGQSERPDLRSLSSVSSQAQSVQQRPGIPASLPSTTSSFPSSIAAHRTPVVYPALLSRVAEAFRARIAVAERVKDGLVYADTFDGRDAVDKIAYIIKTTDRNLALLLGRALDAQKFFHDVTYDHRLRDSPAELYQFRERLNQFRGDAPPDLGLPGEAPSNRALTPTAGRPRSASIADTIASEDSSPVPSGVFTLLTDCYSPTCTRDRLCYSIACPRRLEQQARLNLKPKPGLQRSLSSESLGDDLREPGSLWIHSVPQDVIDSTSDTEKKRQETINEVFSTERDFVRDLEYLRDAWIKPLRTQNIIPEARREDFVTQVFWNVLEIYAVNVRLAEMLNKRQKSGHVVDKIGDIFLEMVPHFSPFVKYGAHQLYGKYEFEKEKAANPAFAKFVDETERLPESRKLELNGYLTKPTTRLARYPLLLEAALKHTADDNQDKVTLPKVVKLVREFLNKVNVETGKSENRFNLAQLKQQLVFKNGETIDLRLLDEEREMIHKGPLKKRGGAQGESAELTVYLFDHAVLMVKEKTKAEQKVYRKPIPLELLVVAPLEDSAANRGGAVRPKSLMSRTAPRYLTNAPPSSDKGGKSGFAMTFIHLGRRGYQITLWCSSWAGRKTWLEKIEGRQQELRERSLVFETIPLSAGYFVGTNRITCAAPFDNGNRMVYGTDNGVYLSNLRDAHKVPVKVISVPNVTQLDVLEEQGILIVLADKAVQTFFVDNLDPGDAIGAAKRARKISSHATFFKAGQCLGRTLVCVVKSGSVSSTIKTLEPVDQARGKKQPAIRKFLQGSNEALRVFKEFYIPTESSSVHFLKSKLCVGCTKGFEIVDLETLDTQGLLDPADSSLDFVQKRENAKPIAIYRIEGDFLLCYDEFAFYVNKNGWRARSNWIIQWEGFPTSFALHYPYVLAFEPTFVEVRHVETGALMQVIPGNSLRCLFADTPPSASSSTPFYTPYGQPRYPQPAGGRSEILLADLDRVFLVTPAMGDPQRADGM